MVCYSVYYDSFIMYFCMYLCSYVLWICHNIFIVSKKKWNKEQNTPFIYLLLCSYHTQTIWESSNKKTVCIVIIHKNILLVDLLFIENIEKYITLFYFYMRSYIFHAYYTFLFRMKNKKGERFHIINVWFRDLHWAIHSIDFGM